LEKAGRAQGSPRAHEGALQTIRRRSNRIAIKTCPPAGHPASMGMSASIKFPPLQSPFVNAGDELFSQKTVFPSPRPT